MKSVYSDKEIYNMINFIIKQKVSDNSRFRKKMILSELVEQLSNHILLSWIINLLKGSGTFPLGIKYKERIEMYVSGVQYNSLDQTKIRAWIYSRLLKYETFVEFLKPILSVKIPEYDFDVIDRDVFDNLDEIELLWQKKMINYSVNNEVKIHSPLNQKKALNSLIQELAEMDYEEGTNIFKNDIEYLKNLRDTSTDTSIPRVSVYEIFNDKKHFDYFEEFVNKYIVDPYKDFSYLYQRMTAEGFIIKQPHKDFMFWLKKYEYIDAKLFEKLMKKGGFESLGKSGASGIRVNNFNVIFHIS